MVPKIDSGSHFKQNKSIPFFDYKGMLSNWFDYIIWRYFVDKGLLACAIASGEKHYCFLSIGVALCDIGFPN